MQHVSKQGTSQIVNRAVVSMITALLLSTIIFGSKACKPEENVVIADKEYKIGILTESSLADKLIADGTEILLVEKGKIDSLKAYTANGTVNFTITAAENSTLLLEVIVKETLGHNEIIHQFSANEDKNLNLSLEAKTHTIEIKITTTTSGEPAPNINYILNPGNYTGTTDAEGKGTIQNFCFDTDIYNQIEQTALTIYFSGNNIKDKTYERVLTVDENDFTFDLMIQDYLFNFTANITGNGKTVDLNKVGTEVLFEYINKEGTTQTIQGTVIDPNTTNFNFIAYKENIEGNVFTYVPRFEKDTIKNVEINGTTLTTKLEPTIYTSNITLDMPTNKTTNEQLPNAITEYAHRVNETNINTGTITGTGNITITHETAPDNGQIINKFTRTTTNEGYNPYNENITITENENITLQTELEETIAQNYNFVVRGTANQGAIIKVWKNGSSVANGTSTNGTYEATFSNTTNPAFEADSVDCTLEGYIRGIIGQTTFEDGVDKIINFNLEEEPQSNNYNFTFIVNNLLDQLLTNGRISIKEPDGDITKITLDGNKLKNANITGTYEANEQIKIWIDNTTLDGNTIAINQNYEMPIASSCSWYTPDTLTVTIDKLIGKTNYVTISDENIATNIKEAAILNPGPGNLSWGYMENGKRTIKPYIIETTPEIETMMENAFAMAYENLSTTTQGLQIFDIKSIGKGTTGPNPVEGHMIAYIQEGVNPGNGKLYDGMLYTAATAHANNTTEQNGWTEEINGMVVERDPTIGNIIEPFFILNGSNIATGFNEEGKKLLSLYHRWEAGNLDNPTD